ncbi:hypothetical protein VTL71DRAFT_12244 [Oculimacula yallundae]|uniref:DUF7908 domain-containing protein n=1 Tax=Oculimacula yallundae TaxID=86028 RepID=A0ABR4CUQ4_9HELO
MLIQAWVSFLPFLARIAGAVPVVHERDSCDIFVGGGNRPTTINKIITTEIVYFPILIDTFISQNTVLRFRGGVAINVYNAPTQVRTIATGTSTATNTAVTTILPGNINIFQTINIINFPVVISTFVEQNTIIQANGGINIVINNAPTFVLTTAIATSTITATVTSTVNTSNSVPTAFLLAPVTDFNPARRLRRQAAQQQFIGFNGNIVTQCTEATVFSINNGQLTSNGNVVSTDTGVVSALFQTSQAIGNISTSFSITDRLIWSNTAFSQGVARFCSTGRSTFALFTTDATIAGCSPQTLIAVPASSCNNGVVGSSSSLSSIQSSTSPSSLSSVPSPTSATSSASSLSEASTSLSSLSSATSSISTTSSASSLTEASTSSSNQPSTPVSSQFLSIKRFEAKEIRLRRKHFVKIMK